ncbi:MAG TPA: hypothetical protein VK756_05010 [Solirubrobacteraceae bacterium]|jgi:hypothetical protein|nr:hypothetical protein [Solirubrobacteraceae bacterium]
MRDPYKTLGSQLAAAAARRDASAPGRRRRWFSGRLRALSVAAALVLGGSAVALAATGVLSGSPVKPEVPPNAAAGNGLPVTGAATHLALVAADPDGGLPWGMRIEHTTRGQLCLQVGRVDGAQLGELGVDSAFANDGRFHALPATVLPPGYGGAAGQVDCVPDGQTMIFEGPNADRSGVRLLPSEFSGPPPKHPGEALHPRGVPPVRDLRALAYGALGPHAVSVTYRTPTGLRTIPVSRPAGAFLIVEPAGYIKSEDTIGGSFSGTARPSSVDVGLALTQKPPRLIAAATFRFAGRLCSQGVGAPVTRPCPMRKIAAPRRPHVRRLDEPVHLTLLAQSHAACDAAFLRFPCYKGRVEFTAPYAVSSTSSDYDIEGIAKCKIGGHIETAWSLERDVKAHELVKTDSLGRFVYTPSCAASEKFQVSYQQRPGTATTRSPEKVIIGTVSLAQATLPRGGKR